MSETYLERLYNELFEKMFRKAASNDNQTSNIMTYQPILENISKSSFLKFKTGGMRAVMGAGFNKINLVTSNMIASTLATRFKSAVIGFDHRINSDLFAYVISKVFKAHNILTTIYRCCTTPYLAWESLNYDIGIMVTASHNSREYNGFKVYLKGSQVVEPMDKELESIFNQIPITNLELDDEIRNYKDSGIRSTEYQAIYRWQEELKDNLSEIDYESFLKSYKLDNVIDNFNATSDETLPTLKINEDGKNNIFVFSALCGIAFPFIKKVEEFFGIKFRTDNTQNKVDGSFPSLDFPNPEIKENWIALLEEYQSKINNITENSSKKYYFFMCDPDGDRFGLAEIEKGNLIVYNGNDIAKIFLWFYLNNYNGRFALVNTFLCDDFFKKVSDTECIPYKSTKTGFKNVSKGVREMKEELNKKNLTTDAHILAFEDTLGYLFDDSTERDGVKAVVLMYHILQNKSVSEIFKELERYGKIESFTKFIRVDNPDKTLDTVLEKFGIDRSKSANKIGHTDSKQKYALLDYQVAYDGHILIFDNFKVILRISGTESVLKVYSFTEKISKEELIKEIDDWIDYSLN